MMQQILTAAQLITLPTSAQLSSGNALQTRSDVEQWVQVMNLSPHLFLLVNAEGLTVRPVMPWSFAPARLDLKHRTDSVNLVPVATLAPSPIAAQGVWWEVSQDEPPLEVSLQGSFFGRGLLDPVSGLGVSVGAFHNADNQTLPATGGSLLTAGVAQLLNLVSNADRQRETGLDGVPALGIASGAQQSAAFILSSSTTVIAAGAGAPQIFTLAAGSIIGSGGFQVGSVVMIDTPANQDVGLVTAVNAGLLQLTVSLPAGQTFKAHGPAAYKITSFVFNQQRDAAGELDGATGIGTSIAAEYEWTAGGPPLASGIASGLQFDRGRNVNGKGLTSVAVTATLIGDTNLVFPANNPGVIGLLPGMPILLTGGAAAEVVYVRQDFSPMAGAPPTTVPLQFPVVRAAQNVAAWDVYQPLGPGLGAILPFGIEIAEDVVWDPIQARFFLERAATADGMVASNIIAEAEALWNGATMDRARSASAANLALQSGLGTELATGPGEWATFSNPGGAVQASASRAAAAGVRHVAKSMVGDYFATGVLAAPSVNNLVLRDGLSGVGTILWSRALGLQLTPAGTTGVADHVMSPPVSIVGTAGNAMTLEFTAAGPLNTFEVISLTGFDAS